MDPVTLNYFKGFFQAAASDPRLGPQHIALYVSLIYLSILKNEPSAVQVSKERLSRMAKIGRTTYYKCLSELETFGYIKYFRSDSQGLRSLVELNLSIER
ncbi:hypothetical protein GCM10027051_30630 [Niabella terrae]